MWAFSTLAMLRQYVKRNANKNKNENGVFIGGIDVLAIS